MLRISVGEGDARRSLNERERKKKDGNRRGRWRSGGCVSGRNDRESVAPLRDAAAGKSEVTAAVAVACK